MIEPSLQPFHSPNYPLVASKLLWGDWAWGQGFWVGGELRLIPHPPRKFSSAGSSEESMGSRRGPVTDRSCHHPSFERGALVRPTFSCENLRGAQLSSINAFRGEGVLALGLVVKPTGVHCIREGYKCGGFIKHEGEAPGLALPDHGGGVGPGADHCVVVVPLLPPPPPPAGGAGGSGLLQATFVSM